MQVQFDNTVWPVVIGTQNDKGDEIRQVLGTAFCLWDRYFITAGHCIVEKIEADEFIGIGSFVMSKGELLISSFINVDLWKDADIAVVEIELPLDCATPAVWNFASIGMLHDVWTAGYPHALDLSEMGFMSRRAFKGYIVSSLPFRPIGQQTAHEAYELSFAAPKGLSGAPLKVDTLPPQVVGMIVANRESGLVLPIEEEPSIEGEKQIVHVYKKIENYGIALTSNQIGHANSSILGSTIESFVRSKNLALPAKSQ